jgi:hypothetical protein
MEDVVDDINGIKEKLDVSRRVLDFLNEKDRVDKLQEGFPDLQKRLKDLEGTWSQMKELESGLADICRAASAAREEMATRALSELQSTFGSYYSKILCHPYYVKLQLIPDEERGKAIYRLRAWDKDFKQGTYVQTRFSNAQMNAVAISLFLSMSTRSQSNLYRSNSARRSLAINGFKTQGGACRTLASSVTGEASPSCHARHGVHTNLRKGIATS